MAASNVIARLESKLDAMLDVQNAKLEEGNAKLEEGNAKLDEVIAKQDAMLEEGNAKLDSLRRMVVVGFALLGLLITAYRFLV